MASSTNLHAEQGKLSSIEAARGIAALMVVFYHAARHLKADFGVLPWGGIFKFGHAGVDFFFVLSGFIIFFVHQQDIGHPSRLLPYFERRFTRIYPLFWVSLAIGLALTGLSSTQTFPDVFAIVQHATLLPFHDDVGVAWTLQHEILFYLFFAVALFHRKTGIAVFATWLGLILTYWSIGYNYQDSLLIARLASTFNLEFFFGMLAAYVVKKYTFKRGYLLMLAGIFIFVGFAFAENVGVFNGYADPAKIAYGFSCMLIVVGLASANLTGRLAAPSALAQLGTASYSIYLLHLPCIGVMYKLLGVAKLLAKIPLDFLYLLLSGGSIVICIMISRTVEYPLTQWVRLHLSAWAKRRKACAELTGAQSDK